MDQHGVSHSAKGARVLDRLLRLTSLVANGFIGAMFLFGALLGFISNGVQKLTIDKLETGLMARYETLNSSTEAPAEFQRHWNYATVVGYVMLRHVYVPLLVAVGSHELWLRRINNQAMENGRPPLRKQYRPKFVRCRARWASLVQAIGIATLVLLALPLTGLAVYGAWVVEDNNPRAGLSFPLAAMNKTLYYGGVVPRTSVDPKTANLSSPELFVDTVSLLRKKGLIHAANPPMSYYALYPGAVLDIPEEMRTTGYYLPRSSFPLLQAHLARSSRQQMGIAEPPPPASANLTTKAIPLGDAIYHHVNTLGLGVNMSSYERFMGDGMPGLPRNLIFGAIWGKVYGNAVNVQCVDVEDEYELSVRESITDTTDSQSASISYTFSQKWSRIPGHQEDYNFTVSSASAAGPLIFAHLSLSNNKEALPLAFGLHHEYGTLRAGERIQPFFFNNAPIHTLFILPDGKRAASSTNPDPKIPSPTILKCIYLPSEFGMVFGALSEEIGSKKKGTPKADTISTAGPLKFRAPPKNGKSMGPDGRPMEPPPAPRCVNPMYAIPAARAVHELLTNPEPSGQYQRSNTTAGGVLRAVLAEYYARNPPHPGFGRWNVRNARYLKDNVIEPVLSATGSAYFSLLRQRVEIANIWVPLDATGLKSKPKGLRIPQKSKGKKNDHMTGAGVNNLNPYTGSQRDAIGLDVAEDVLVKGMVFWVLRIGGAAPYGLHWVGLLVLLWIGVRATKAAWRTFMFGRGERRWGRWWEEATTTLPGKGVKVVVGNGDEEKSELGKVSLGEDLKSSEPLLGTRYSDAGADGKGEVTGSDNV